MDLLENLYNIENFGIYLFIVIGILFILFLVILFFGKKDEKKRKLEETQLKEAEPPKEEIPVSNPVTETIPEPVPAPPVMEMPQEEVVAPSTLGTSEPMTQMPFQEIKEPVQPVEVPAPVLEKPNVPDLASVALSQIEEEQKESVPVEPVQEEKREEPIMEKEFDFNALADAINKELASIENPEEPVPTPVLPKEVEAPLQYSVVEDKPVLEPTVEPTLQTPSVEAPKPEKKVMPTVFSSVYVNREKEEPIVMPKKEEIPEPVAPKIELPKTIDLPKRNNE